MSLLSNSIYLVLYYLEPEGSDNYHWGIVVKTWDYPDGVLFHVIYQSYRWSFEAKPSAFGLSKTSTLALKIGSLPPVPSAGTSWMQLRNIVTRVMLNWPLGFSCRTWVKDAVTELHKAGILSCPSVEALEQEARHLATIYRHGRERSEGPWGHHISAVSS